MKPSDMLLFFCVILFLSFTIYCCYESSCLPSDAELQQFVMANEFCGHEVSDFKYVGVNYCDEKAFICGDNTGCFWVN